MKLSATQTSGFHAVLFWHRVSFTLQTIPSFSLSLPGQYTVSHLVRCLRSNVACDTSSGCKHQICDKRELLQPLVKWIHLDCLLFVNVFLNHFVFVTIERVAAELFAWMLDILID